MRVNQWHPVYEREQYLVCMRESFETLALHMNNQTDISHNTVDIKGVQCFMGYKNADTQRMFIFFSNGYQFEEKMIHSTKPQRLARTYNKRRSEKKKHA